MMSLNLKHISEICVKKQPRNYVQLVNDICPPIMKIIFSFRENEYNLRKFKEMKQQKYRNYPNWC